VVISLRFFSIAPRFLYDSPALGFAGQKSPSLLSLEIEYLEYVELSANFLEEPPILEIEYLEYVELSANFLEEPPNLTVQEF
jgi:hypothetical protein